MNRLRQMSVFAHIVEAGSITAAAELLQLSKSVVSQHLKSLETDIGVALLKRTTRRQTLTAAGERFYQQCRKLNEVADSAWTQAQDSLHQPQGKIRITAPNALMGSLIAPAVGQLVTRYPKLQPELISSDSQLNLIEDNIDLAIRVGRSAQSNLKQRRLGEFRDVLCMSQSQPKHDNAETYPYVANRWQGTRIKHELSHKRSAKPLEFLATAQCLGDSFHTCLALIESGAGIGLVPEFVFKTKVARLVEVFPDYQLPLNPVFALHPYSQHLPLSVSACLASIENYLSRTISK